MRDIRAIDYLEKDGRMYFPGMMQSDVFFVPTRWAQPFAKASRLHSEHGVFLECAFPKILYSMVTPRATVGDSGITTSSANEGVTYRDIGAVCTDFSKLRGTPQMIQTCMEGNQTNGPNNGYGIYHPFKLSKGHGLWKYMLDIVQSANGTAKSALTNNR